MIIIIIFIFIITHTFFSIGLSYVETAALRRRHQNAVKRVLRATAALSVDGRRWRERRAGGTPNRPVRNSKRTSARDPNPHLVPLPTHPSNMPSEFGRTFFFPKKI